MERFYADTLVTEHADYCKLGLLKTCPHISIWLLMSFYLPEVYYNDIPAGTVCACVEKSTKEGEHKLYSGTCLYVYMPKGIPA